MIGNSDMSGSKEIETGTKLRIKFNEEGLVPAILQDVDSRAVLMMAWMNKEALAGTLEKGKAMFYSRSRGKIWVKGESSGHVQRVVEVRVDCDQDVVLLRVKSDGPACHVGYQSCFYRAVETIEGDMKFVEDKVFDPDEVYGG